MMDQDPAARKGVGARIQTEIGIRSILRGNGADDQTGGMRSRVHPTYKTNYRVENWASYDRALVRRGDVTVWVSAEAIAAWEPAGVGTRGGPLKYSDLAIETALTLVEDPFDGLHGTAHSGAVADGDQRSIAP